MQGMGKGHSWKKEIKMKRRSCHGGEGKGLGPFDFSWKDSSKEDKFGMIIIWLLAGSFLLILIALLISTI
jgi:hypothetical protein